MAQVKLGTVQWEDLVQVGPVSLTTDVSGVLPVANGGTGSGSFTNGQLLIGNTTTGNTLAKATLTGTANQIVVTNGAGSITLALAAGITVTGNSTFQNDGNNAFNTFDSYNSVGATTTSFNFMRRARGSLASPSALLSGDWLGAFAGSGHNGSTMQLSSRAIVGFVAAEAWDSTHNGTDMVFYTTPLAATAVAEKMRLTNAGNLLLGTTTTPTGAIFNKVYGGGTTSPVVGAATADLVNTCGFDRVNTRHAAAGNRLLAVQGERGSTIYIGDDALDFAATTAIVSVNATDVLSMTSTAFDLTNKITKYNNISTSANGLHAIVASGRFTAQTAAKASVAAYTLPASDGSYQVVANVRVTTATTHNFTVTCAYTDEQNIARTLTMNFSLEAGTFATAVTAANSTIPYMGIPMNIRCKASTSITIATTGSFGSVIYNVEGFITQIS